MALSRAFSVDRFSKIGIADFLSEGYVLKVKKNSARKFCLNCIRNFCASEGLRLTEDADYLTIYS